MPSSKARFIAPENKIIAFHETKSTELILNIKGGEIMKKVVVISIVLAAHQLFPVSLRWIENTTDDQFVFAYPPEQLIISPHSTVQANIEIPFCDYAKARIFADDIQTVNYLLASQDLLGITRMKDGLSAGICREDGQFSAIGPNTQVTEFAKTDEGYLDIRIIKKDGSYAFESKS